MSDETEVVEVGKTVMFIQDNSTPVIGEVQRIKVIRGNKVAVIKSGSDIIWCSVDRLSVLKDSGVAVLPAETSVIVRADEGLHSALYAVNSSPALATGSTVQDGPVEESEDANEEESSEASEDDDEDEEDDDWEDDEDDDDDDEWEDDEEDEDEEDDDWEDDEDDEDDDDDEWEDDEEDEDEAQETESGPVSDPLPETRETPVEVNPAPVSSEAAVPDGFWVWDTSALNWFVRCDDGWGKVLSINAHGAARVDLGCGRGVVDTTQFVTFRADDLMEV